MVHVHASVVSCLHEIGSAVMCVKTGERLGKREGGSGVREREGVSEKGGREGGRRGLREGGNDTHVLMCMCMYRYCTCIYKHMYMYMYTCMHIHLHVYIYVCTCTCMYI